MCFYLVGARAGGPPLGVGSRGVRILCKHGRVTHSGRNHRIPPEPCMLTHACHAWGAVHLTVIPSESSSQGPLCGFNEERQHYADYGLARHPERVRESRDLLAPEKQLRHLTFKSKTGFRPAPE